MDAANEELDDSALLCMSVFQKRKAPSNFNSRTSKQLKLSFVKSSQNVDIHPNGKTLELDDSNSHNKNLNESSSSYFSNKKNCNVCPLCLKSFESDSVYATHMKQCAKKRNMTTQQLLGALELQKKHLGERRAMGLCSQISISANKPKKRNTEKSLEPDYDLALGLALSKSLETTDLKFDSKPEIKTEVPLPLLEEFGFTSSSTAGPSKKKSKVIKKSILRERTKEERQRIITEKAAVVLLAENNDCQNDLTRQSFSSKNFYLAKLQKQVPYLWNLGENEGKLKWYVGELVNLFQDDNKENSLPLRTSTPVQCADIQSAVSKLNLPQGNLYQDMCKLINNEKFSDLNGTTKDGQTFYLHSFIIFVRCPNILDKNLKIIFQDVNLSTVLIFLEYLYSGTLNGLSNSELDNLHNLSVKLNFEELITVLNCLKESLLEKEVIITDSNEKCRTVLQNSKEKLGVTVLQEDQEETLVDLTQNSFEDDIVCKSDESNEEKSFWSFLQHEKEKEKVKEEKQIGEKEEKKENLEISKELEKIELSIKHQEKMMKRIINEFEGEETILKDSAEMKKNDLRESDSETKDVEEFQKKLEKSNEDVIVLSSDTETRESKEEEKAEVIKEVEYELPHYDPYENFDEYSPVGIREDIQSQSFITGDVSFCLEEIEEENKTKKLNPEYFSTPLSKRQCSLIDSSVKKSLNKRKRKSDLSASRIVRKSLGLKQKSSRFGLNKSKTAKNCKKNSKVNEDLAETLTNSIMKDLCNSPLFNSSTPLRSKNFVELTPFTNREIDCEDYVTPSPNYSAMGESMIKEHLSKYGLKRNLAKSKAKKILRHIYEELHPILNTKTGKLVKMLPNETTKGQKKQSKAVAAKKTIKSGKSKIKSKSSKKISDQSNSSSKESNFNSNDSLESLDKSTDNDSGGSEFEDLVEPSTQSAPNNPLDLPLAFEEYLSKNPKFYQKILLYEPIWLEELQKSLKETFRKNFKLTDLMDYLDQKCITFRSEAQKRNNERRAKRKNSPRKKKNPTS